MQRNHFSYVGTVRIWKASHEARTDKDREGKECQEEEDEPERAATGLCDNWNSEPGGSGGGGGGYKLADRGAYLLQAI